MTERKSYEQRTLDDTRRETIKKALENVVLIDSSSGYEEYAIKATAEGLTPFAPETYMNVKENR